MKQFLILLLFFLVSPITSNAQITCDVFDINYELNSNELLVSLETDLPDNTILMVSISRSYWEKGNASEYSIDYYSERTTVGKWRKDQRISVDNSIWETKLESKQKEMAGVGLGFDVDKISDEIAISMVVPINQSNPKFGDRNANLSGEKVNTSGFRVVRSEEAFDFPLDGTVSKESKFASPSSLKIGTVYVLPKKVPLMPEFEPQDPLKALENAKEIDSGNLIEVISTKYKSGTPWYEVKVLNSTETGWVNSQALIGKSLQIKE